MVHKSKLPTGETVEIIISDNAINNGFKKIGNATDLEMIITTKSKEVFQADVFLRSGWTTEELQEIIIKSLLNCGEKCESITATIKGIISMN